MNESERRRYPRYETEILVTIYIKDEKISGTIIDMGKHGFRLVSEKAIQPGSQVMIALNFTDDYAINGIIKWSSQIKRDQNVVYIIGIEVESIIWTYLKAMGFPEWDELAAKILSETKNQKIKIKMNTDG